MSEAKKTPTAETSAGEDHVPELDISKLHALPTEQQDLYLLTFVSDLRQFVGGSTADQLPARQPAIKKEIIKIVGLNAPVPSRVIRQSLGRILADIFTRGSRQVLHETVNDLLAFVTAAKGDKDATVKHTATTCLGFTFMSAGQSAVGLHGLVVSSLVKLLKSTSNHAGFRASVFRALGHIVSGLESSLDEQVAKDIWKQARNAAGSDKSSLAQKHACFCIQALFDHTTYFQNSNDFETLKSTVWKVIENNATATRLAGADLLAAVTVKSHSEITAVDRVPVVRKPKKSNKKQGPVSDDEAETDRPEVNGSSQTTTRLALTLEEILRVISAQYCKTATSNRARGALAICYKFVLERLPDRVLQDKYSVLAQHFCNELLGHMAISSNRYRLLLTRRFVQTLLSNVVAKKRLTESAQINAARYLINDILKNYPRVLPERREPSKHCLAAALRALSYLLSCLGPAANAFQDSCREALFQVSQHPSYTVQVQVAACCRIFVHACPSQLSRTVGQALEQIKKELDGAEGSSPRKSIVYAISIAAMLRSARANPLYGSIELFSALFTYATDLLKASATSELRLCATQVQVAWTILGGLTTLGSSFTKVHLNQLLLLWRNALPPPLTQDNTARRGNLELSFLAHVREHALAALLTFLTFNGSLITSDGSRRISTMLQNSNMFTDTLPIVRQSTDLSSRLIPALQIHDHTVLLRRRILQCLTRLLNLKHLDRAEIVSQTDIAGSAIRVFTSPEWPLQKSLEASLSTSASNFEGIWDAADNWGSGVNSMVETYEMRLPTTSLVTRIGIPQNTLNDVEQSFVQSSISPIAPALEHDFVQTYSDDINSASVLSFSPETSCLTNAVELFAVALPLQSPRIQESSLEQLATVLAQPLTREPGRKFTLLLNAITAVLGALAVANGETEFNSGKLAVQTIGKSVAEIIRRGVLDHDATMRAIATQALGRLCCLAGNQFTNNEVKNLIDTVVANREPHVRAGCALALGVIHSQVGAMAASYHLKNIVGVMLSLCSDPHPLVHHWALRGLEEVTTSAGLSFSAYASSTLGMLAQLYLSQNHDEECSSVTASNTEIDVRTTNLIGNCVDSIINVLGPDLQDVGKSRALILNLVQFFQAEDDVALQARSYYCLGHIWLYAPAHIQLSKYVQNLQEALTSGDQLLEAAAVNGLENLMKRNASGVLYVADSGFGEELWTKLDKNPGTSSLQNMLRTWMQQTCLTDTLEWVQQCQNILSRTRIKAGGKASVVATAKAKSALPDLADEEVAGFAAAAAVAEAEKPEASADTQEFLRWQTRDFAMALLSEMLDQIRDAMLPDQVIPAESALQSKVADIVRIAFSASTATVVNLRVKGLHILDQILKLFGRTPDPDFLEASLLEQYQAQISSALTPAFAVDSNAELAAEAIAVCSTFAATGIVTNADRMGRIFKVLSTGLENLSQDQAVTSIGDLKDLSSNGQSMLKMSLLSGWAQLQLATGEQGYLETIVLPYVPKLAPLWLTSLQEFAALRFEPEISDSLGEYATNDLHERYAAFDREVRLGFYQKSWLNIVDAIALLVEKDSNAVFDALDNKISTNGATTNGSAKSGRDMSFREEPVAFFFILFGLAYEALVTQARDDQTQVLAILTVLKRILTPALAGSALYQDAVFDETTNTLDRLALTGSSDNQLVLVQLARNLSLDHIIAKAEGRDDKLSDDIDQLFELTRIIILVLSGLVPTLEGSPSKFARPLTEDNIALIELSFQALVDVADVFPAIIRTDLHACITHSYCTVLATGHCQAQVIPRIMPIFRSFLSNIATSSLEPDTTNTLLNTTLSRMLSILTHAQRRENDHSVPCARNTLLSITVLLTTTGSALLNPHTNPSIPRATSEIFDCLQDVGLAKAAATCVRSLLTTPSTKSGSDEIISRILWPQTLLFVMDTQAEDPEQVKTALMQSLVLSAGTIKANAKASAAAITLLVPALIARSSHAVPNGSTEDLARESAARLLELAAIDPLAFRAVVGRLDTSQRSVLENLLRSVGVGAGARAGGAPGQSRQDVDGADEGGDSQPAIALRMDFD